MTSTTYLTVKALTKYIKYKFDADPHLRDVYVKGELSNVKIHTSGHIYFTLKDETTRIQATMFRAQATRLAFRPEEGMQVFIRGDVNVYEASGTYQLYAQTMEPDGIGGLFVAFNQLKQKLHNEGLFNPQWKQPIPLFPQKVGVLTATTGAAIRDICTTIRRRYPLAEICIYPTLVQGANAAQNIAKNIALANAHAMCDVLIVGRGGGSIEDLWAFNEEIVARAIFESRIPIISAVGHETDTTIADFVADLRAPTPTAAAELAVPNQQELYQRVLTNQSRLHQMMTARLQYERSRLQTCMQSYPLSHPERLYRPFTERLIQMDVQLANAQKYFMLERRGALEKVLARLQMQSPKQRLLYARRDVDVQTEQLTRLIQQQFVHQKQRFQNSVRMLEALNPLAIMTKGFSVTYTDGKVVKSVHDVKEHDRLSIEVQDGMIEAQVIETKEKGE